jgi:RNA polymerase sigma-70 factor (ECF subfamily)
LVAAIGEQLDHWRRRGDWAKLQCIELLFVRGWANKEVATQLAISEQTVANYKFEFLARLRKALRHQQLPDAIFPELYE